MSKTLTRPLMIISVCVAFAATGCKKSTPAANTAPAPTKPAPKPAPKPKTKPAPAPAKPTATKAAMKKHFTQATLLNVSTIQAQLDSAKKAAAVLAKGPDKPPAKWKPLLEPLTKAAKEIEQAKDIQAVAQGLGKLGAACGSCHTTLKAKVVFEEKALVSGKDDVREHMHRHDWAAARLWEGLIAPDQQRWEAAAHLLHEKALHELPKIKDKAKAKQVAGWAKQVHKLGKEALTTKEPAKQAALYGKLTTLCASCHQVTRPELIQPAKK